MSPAPITATSNRSTSADLLGVLGLTPWNPGGSFTRKRIVQRFYVDHAERTGLGRTELLVREYPQLKYEPREHHCTEGLLPVHIFSPLPRSQLLMANTSVRELRTMVIAGACSTCCLRSPRGERRQDAPKYADASLTWTHDFAPVVCHRSCPRRARPSETSSAQSAPVT